MCPSKNIILSSDWDKRYFLKLIEGKFYLNRHVQFNAIQAKSKDFLTMKVLLDIAFTKYSRLFILFQLLPLCKVCKIYQIVHEPDRLVITT